MNKYIKVRKLIYNNIQQNLHILSTRALHSSGDRSQIDYLPANHQFLLCLSLIPFKTIFILPHNDSIGDEIS